MTCATCSHRWLGQPSVASAVKSGVAIKIEDAQQRKALKADYLARHGWYCRTRIKPMVFIGNNNDLKAATGCKEFRK